MSFNSLSQWQRFGAIDSAATSLGLRINPKLSFAPDPRYDPCRLHSKLGIDINVLCAQGLPASVRGLHIHTVFSATDFEPLLQTVTLLKAKLGHAFKQLCWLNLGGGYLFSQIADHQPFIELVQQLRADFNLEVFIEPGKAVVDHAGYLISSVIDRFESDGQQLAVLDTSVNHLPEVFEYQRSPSLSEHRLGGEHAVTLVGSSCLAGDVFGEYLLEQPLMISDRVVFKNVGAYSLIKSQRFNGYPLPTVYSLSNQVLKPLYQDRYEHYRQQWFV